MKTTNHLTRFMKAGNEFLVRNLVWTWGSPAQQQGSYRTAGIAEHSLPFALIKSVSLNL